MADPSRPSPASKEVQRGHDPVRSGRQGKIASHLRKRGQCPSLDTLREKDLTEESYVTGWDPLDLIPPADEILGRMGREPRSFGDEQVDRGSVKEGLGVVT